MKKNTKRIIAIVLSILTVLSVLSLVVVNAADTNKNTVGETSKDGLWSYFYEEGKSISNKLAGWCVTGYNGAHVDELTLPDEIDGNKITLARNLNTFRTKKLYIPNNYKKILTCGTTNYTDTVEEIYFAQDFDTKEHQIKLSERAVAQCKNLTKVVLPNKIATPTEPGHNGGPITNTEDGITTTYECFDIYALAFNPKLKYVKLPENITEIPYGMFKNDTSLERIILPDRLEYFSVSALEGCTNLKEIYIPNTLKSYPNSQILFRIAPYQQVDVLTTEEDTKLRFEDALEDDVNRRNNDEDTFHDTVDTYYGTANVNIKLVDKDYVNPDYYPDYPDKADTINVCELLDKTTTLVGEQFNFLVDYNTKPDKLSTSDAEKWYKEYYKCYKKIVGDAFSNIENLSFYETDTNTKHGQMQTKGYNELSQPCEKYNSSARENAYTSRRLDYDKVYKYVFKFGDSGYCKNQTLEGYFKLIKNADGTITYIKAENPNETETTTPITTTETNPIGTEPVTNPAGSEPVEATTAPTVATIATMPPIVPQTTQAQPATQANTQPATKATDPIEENASTVTINAKTVKTTTVTKSYNAGKILKVNIKNIGSIVPKFTSSKKDVVSVTNKGQITCRKKGSAVITITIGNVTVKYNITVKNNPTIKIAGKSFKAKKTYPVKKGKALKIKIIGKAKTYKNSYVSSNKKVAKIVSKKTSATIKAKALKKGKATITIKVNGVKKYKIKVRVK